jgi:S1-C subfamily serine protease
MKPAPANSHRIEFVPFQALSAPFRCSRVGLGDSSEYHPGEIPKQKLTAPRPGPALSRYAALISSSLKALNNCPSSCTYLNEEPMRITIGTKFRTVLSVLILSAFVSHLPLTTRADELTTEEIAKQFTSSVMVVNSGDSQGTGFVVSDDGVLVTNFHVIEGGGKIFVKSAKGGIYEVQKVLAVDKQRDVAVLKIHASNLNSTNLADEASLNPGSKVVVIGNPAGLEHTISEGIVSANRILPEYGEVIQITAPISSGSSGSPVFDIRGDVIGIATFKRVDGEALNFAIPSQRIIDLLKSLGQAKSSAELRKSYVPKAEVKGSPSQDEALSSSVSFEEILTLQDEGSYFEMFKMAKELVQEFPDSALAYRLLSQACLSIEMLDDAVKNAKKAIDLDPENARGWTILSESYTALGDKEGASKVLADAIKIAPDDAVLLIFYAASVRDTNDSLAVGALKAALNQLKQGKGNDLESEFYLPDVALVEELNRNGPRELAYEACESLLQVRPDSLFLLINKAKAALNVKKFDEVRPALSRVFQLDPDYANSGHLHFIVGQLEEAQHNLDLAEESYKKSYILSLEENDAAVLDSLIALYAVVCQKPIINEEDIATFEYCLIESERFDSELARRLSSSIKKTLKNVR